MAHSINLASRPTATCMEAFEKPDVKLDYLQRIAEASGLFNPSVLNKYGISFPLSGIAIKLPPAKSPERHTANIFIGNFLRYWNTKNQGSAKMIYRALAQVATDQDISLTVLKRWESALQSASSESPSPHAAAAATPLYTSDQPGSENYRSRLEQCGFQVEKDLGFQVFIRTDLVQSEENRQAILALLMELNEFKVLNDPKWTGLLRAVELAIQTKSGIDPWINEIEQVYSQIKETSNTFC